MKRFLLLLLLFSSIVTLHLHAAVVVDSIVTTPSSCQDNGVITIYAHGTGSLVYAIIAGPLTHAQQSANVFRALPAGAYTIAVSDASGQRTTRAIAVAGTYTVFDFEPYAIYPRCQRDSGVTLIGHADTVHGLHPFTWQLMPGSPVSTQPQRSDTFYITMPGTYEIRCTDACGNVRSRLYTIDHAFNSSISLAYPYHSYILHCDSMTIGEDIRINGGEDNLAFPLTFTEYSTHGDTMSYTFPNYIRDTLVAMGNGFLRIQYGYISLNNRFGAVHPGDIVYTILTDGCGDTVRNDFIFRPYSLSLDGWGSYTNGDCLLYSYPTFSINLAYPSRWIILDNATNRIVDSSSNTGGISSHPANRYYTFVCFDSCGDTLRQSFLWQLPVISAPIVSPGIRQNTCMDSTASVRIGFSGFKNGVSIQILTGPASAHSSKPGYSYSTRIRYPIIFPAYAELSGFPAGHYTYMVSDTCGNAVSGSFDITPDQLSSFSHTLTSGRQCPGGNSIYYRYSNTISTDNVSIYYMVKNLSTGQVLDSAYAQGSDGGALINNLNPGTFEFKLVISGGWSGITDSLFCTTVYDTVVIPPYLYPSLLPVSVSGCAGSEVIQAVMDSTKGVAPYYYQIVSGPQISPPQMDGSFQVTQPGVYAVIALDQCGNGMVRNISVDSARQVPVSLVVTDSCFRAYVGGVRYTESAVLSDTARSVLGCDSAIRVDSIIIRGKYAHRPIIHDMTDTFCIGVGGEIIADSGYSRYEWSTGDSATRAFVRDSGWYYLTVTDAEQCAYQRSAHISLTDTPRVATGWVVSDSVCIDDPLELHLTLSTDDAHYHWDDYADPGLDRSFSDSGMHTFTVANQCATSMYIIRTTEKTCNEYVYVPNAFTPNGNGMNDLFMAYASYDFASMELRVFDRWGEKVYEGHDLAKGWNGRYKDCDLPAGVYVYEYAGTWPSGHTKKGTGSITLIR